MVSQTGRSLAGPPPVENTIETDAEPLEAPAQGILAQFRIFGGSLGIAASTAMLRTELIGIPTTFSKSDGIQTGMITRMAYARAFQKDMVAATAITGLAVVTIFFALWQSRKRGYKLSR